MGKICLGNAPDSWGIWFPQDKRQVGWDVFLNEVHEAGYTCIELGPWAKCARSELQCDASSPYGFGEWDRNCTFSAS
jgi:hypothetical protein